MRSKLFAASSDLLRRRLSPASLREQCLALLRRYLDRSAMFTSSKNTAITLVADSLPKVMQ